MEGDGAGPPSPLGQLLRAALSMLRSNRGFRKGAEPPSSCVYNEGAPSGHPNTYVCVRRASPHARTRAALMGPTAPGPYSPLQSLFSNIQGALPLGEPRYVLYRSRGLWPPGPIAYIVRGLWPLTLHLTTSIEGACSPLELPRYFLKLV